MPPLVNEDRHRRAVIARALVVVAALKQDAAVLVGRVGPGEAAVVTAPNKNRAVLLGGAQDVNAALVQKERAPVAVHDVRDIDPGRPIVLGPIDTGETFLRLVVSRTTGSVIIVRDKESAVGQPEHAGAAEIGAASLGLVL